MDAKSVCAFRLRTKRYTCDENTRRITGEVSAYGPIPEEPSDPVSGLESPDLSHPDR